MGFEDTQEACSLLFGPKQGNNLVSLMFCLETNFISHLTRSPKMKNKTVSLESVLLGAVASLSLFGFQSAVAVSFNCSKASNVIESLICKDSSLSKKDSQLAGLYRKALKDLPRSMQRELRDEQRDWLTARDSCDDRECLELLYSKRIYELKHYFE